MHTSERTDRAAQARHLQESLITQLAKGREWATPGVETALRRVLSGMDNGIEAASPRIQASLRAIADELAGGVEVVTPRLHERIARIIPVVENAPPDAVQPGTKPRMWWLIIGIAAAAAAGGITLWQAMRPVGESPVETQDETPYTEDTLSPPIQ